jgi:uncharacterized membrane protein YbhN (UPF0104 family)
VLAGLQAWPLVVLSVLTVLVMGLRAFRWRLFLRAQSLPVSLGRTGALYATGVFLGSFTPGRVGDLAKAVYLRRECGLSWEKALANSLVDRLLDLGLMLALGVWAAHHWGLWGDAATWGAIVSLVVGGGLAVLLVVHGDAMVVLAGDRYPALRRALLLARGLATEARRFGAGVSLLALGFTFLAYGVYFAQTAWMARLLGLPIPGVDVVGAVVLFGLAAFLPVSVAGLGTREGILTLLLARRGVPDPLEWALVFSGLYFAYCFVLPALLGGVCWLARPIPLTPLDRPGDE